MTRSPQYEQGRRNGVKWAVTWLYERAELMTDPSARAALNVAADLLGNKAKLRRDLPRIIRSNAKASDQSR